MSVFRFPSVLSAILCFALSTTVQAADKVAPNSARYSGLYAGLHLAGFALSDHWYGSSVDHKDYSVHGLSGGVHFGLGETLGSSLYLGIEIDASLANTSYSFMLPVGSGYDARLNYDAAARVRVGYVLGNLLVFGTVGPAMASVDRTFIHPTLGTQDFQDLAFGWTAGVGAEFAFTDNSSIFVEYKQAHLGTISESFWLPSVEHNDLTSESVLVGLNYKFN